MHKTTTSLNKTDLKTTSKESKDDYNNLNPTAATLENIMKFAASYRVQNLKNNQYVEMFLN